MRRGHAPGPLGLSRWLAIGFLTIGLLFLLAGVGAADTGTFSISGKVTDASNPDHPGIQNMYVFAYDAYGNFVWFGDATNDEGSYSSPELTPGVYKVRTGNDLGYIDQWYGNGPTQSDPAGTGALPVDISSGNATGIDFALDPGYTISGTVTDALTTNPIPNVWINLPDAAGDWRWVGARQTDDNGVYWFRGLIPGVYKVLTAGDANNLGYINQWYLDDPVQGDPMGTGALPVDISSGNRSDIDFALTLGRSISGRVTDASNPAPVTNGIPNVGIHAYDGSSNNPVAGAGTDVDGYYSLRGLIPGVYRVVTGNQGYIELWYGNVLWDGNYTADAAPVDVSATDATDIDIALAPNTPAGDGETTVTQPNATVTFAHVTQSGVTLVVPVQSAPPAEFSTNGGYYDVTTTCAYTGWIVLSFPYDTAQFPNPSLVRVFHQDHGVWQDVTVKVEDGLVYARVNSLSLFVITQLGVALYSGGDATLSGSCKVESPLLAGQPSAVAFVNGKLTTKGSVDLSQVVLYVKARGAAVPPLNQFMPDALVASLTLASQAAQPTGTTYNGLSYGGSKSVTFTRPITVNGNLTISGSGTYTFDSVYVTGDVTISGSPTFRFASLRVGGTLTVSGGVASYWGPTYATGDTKLSGSGRWNASLFVTSGALTISGSQTIGGDGVGAHAKPVRILLVGPNKLVTFSGASTFYGLLCNQLGGFTQSGAGIIRGSVLVGGPYTASGSCDLKYDQNVLDNLN